MNRYDVVIVGGGPAGLSAGLILGRFRRNVLICDSGQPRNARAQGVHNFLSRDGIPPSELLQIAREQLQPYSTVEFRSQQVADIVRHAENSEVIFADGCSENAKYILLATGVKDELPPIEGIDGLWGSSVYHCPFCHGWEARDKAIAVLADVEKGLHLTKLLYLLSQDIVICTDGDSDIDSEQKEQLERQNVRLITTPIRQLQTNGTILEGIEFEDGTFLAREVIFVNPAQSHHSSLPDHLGCVVDGAGRVIVDEMGKTSVEGIYAAGDLTSPMQQVIFAAAQGARVAAGINFVLAHELFSGDGVAV